MARAKKVSLYEAKTHLSEFIERAANGEEFIVSKSGKPKARILPLALKPNAVRLGVWKGKLRIGEDFDDPLPDDLLAAFGEVPE
jgi:prevent-host-death family protein